MRNEEDCTCGGCNTTQHNSSQHNTTQLITTQHSTTHHNTTQPTTDIEFNEENEDEELFYVDLCGKQMLIKEDIPLVKDDITTESIILFKDALLSTISKLNEMVDFLKNELEEKNLFIRTLLLRDANDTDMISIGLLNKSNVIEITSNISENANFTDVNNSDISISQDNSHDDEDDISNESNDNSSLYTVDSNIISSLLTIDKCANYSNISTVSIDLFSNTSILNETFVINTAKRNHESLGNQLENYRTTKHNNYIMENGNQSCNSYNDVVINNAPMTNDFDLNNSMSYKINIVPTVIKSKKWPENTVLITEDSILNNLQENRLNRNFNVKVRCFPGADIDDMFDFITPLLKKAPSYIILHIGGTNDAIDKSSTDILNGILKLKLFIENKLPSVEVYFSCPVLRLDNSKAS